MSALHSHPQTHAACNGLTSCRLCAMRACNKRVLHDSLHLNSDPDRKWGSAYLTREFFFRIGETMPEQVRGVAQLNIPMCQSINDVLLLHVGGAGGC